LVAFPTETVYGLGANALNEEAVERIYRAKGRPSTSPLIVHCANAAMARSLAAEWPDAAERLATNFWPGPLTLVLPKVAVIPARVTAGLDTVGLRVPRHPVALALLEAAGVPIAAPSANPFMGLSPTLSAHVAPSLADMVLEGGPAEVGIESTVISLAGPPTLLRPGSIPLPALEDVLGITIVKFDDGDSTPLSPSHRAPGLHPQHYSPTTPLILMPASDPLPPGRGVWLDLTRTRKGVDQIPMPSDARRYAQCLYAILHTVDRQGWDWIAVEPPPDGAAWEGVRDRLVRAQHS
jgi:L-threonylcarbamoyladenylate synthase